LARSSRLARGYFLLPSAVYPWDDGERPMLSRLFRFVVGALAALFSLALTGVIVLDQFVPTNPWTGSLKGQALVFLWDRQSTLSCTGNSVMVVEGVNVQRTFAPLFEASGHCQLRLQGARAQAPRILVATDDARVVLAGGRLEAPSGVLEVSGRAVVQVEGTELVGPVRREGAARIEGLPPGSSGQTAGPGAP